MSTRRVTITPRINLRMGSSDRSYWGRWGGLGASFAPAKPGLVQLTEASLCSAEPLRLRSGQAREGAHSHTFFPRLSISICFEAAGFADYIAYLGQVALLLRWRKRNR